MSNKHGLSNLVPYFGAALAFAGVLYATQRNLNHSLRKERFDAYLKFLSTCNFGYRALETVFRDDVPDAEKNKQLLDYSTEMEPSFASMNLASPNYVRQRGLKLKTLLMDVTRADGEPLEAVQLGGPIKKPLNREDFSGAFSDFLAAARFDLRHQFLSSLRSIAFAINPCGKTKRNTGIPEAPFELPKKTPV